MPEKHTIEKVIAGLRCCVMEPDLSERQCRDEMHCPYVEEGTQCMQTLMRDALEQLSALSCETDETSKPFNVQTHRILCRKLMEIYERKNHDYGDSFLETFREEGFAMSRIRLTDKLSRFKALTKDGARAQVLDESIRDTLMDLANYAIMTVVEMEREEEQT